MKKMRIFIWGAFCLFNVTSSYSQFYDVKMKKRATVINTRREDAYVNNNDRKENESREVSLLRAASRSGAVVPATEERPSMTGGGISAGDDGASVVAAQSSVIEYHPSDSVEHNPLPTVFDFKESSYFCSPLDRLEVTSPYGFRSDPFSGKRKFHRGTDYATHSENVYAIMPGRIEKIGYNRKLGNYITLNHGDLSVTYGHLHTVVGEKGDVVRAGQSIGLSGSTGRSTGEHLHVGMKYKKDWIDPDPILRYIHRYSLGTSVLEEP